MSSDYKVITNTNPVIKQTYTVVTNRRWRDLTARGPDVCCEIMSSSYNRDSIPMKPQNYGHPNKNWNMTISTDMLIQRGEISQGPIPRWGASGNYGSWEGKIQSFPEMSHYELCNSKCSDPKHKCILANTDGLTKVCLSRHVYNN